MEAQTIVMMCGMDWVYVSLYQTMEGVVMQCCIYLYDKYNMFKTAHDTLNRAVTLTVVAWMMVVLHMRIIEEAMLFPVAVKHILNR